MADTLGTDAGNLTGQGGSVANTAGDTLLGTDNDGGTSYALGPSLSRAIETGIINGDFGTPPPELSTNIDNAENALPYFTAEVSHTDATAPYVQAVADLTAASGQVLRFTIPSGAAIGRYARIVRYVAVPGSAARTWTNQPRAAWRNATGTTKTQAVVTIRTQYYQNDGTTTTGTQGTNTSKTFADVFASTYAYETQANPNVTGAIPTDGAYLKIEVGVQVSVLTTSALTVDLTEVRYDRGLIQLLLADQVDPGTYGYGVIYLNNGTMWIRANETGPSGSNPTIYLSGSTGNIIIDPTSTGTVQVQGNMSVANDISASGNLNLQPGGGGVVMGGSTYTAGGATVVGTLTAGSLISNADVTLTGTVINQRASATNDVWLSSQIGDSVNRFLIEANGGMFWGSGSAARDTNLYRDAANSLKTDDSMTVGGNFLTNAGQFLGNLDTNGTFASGGLITSATSFTGQSITTTTNTANAAIWVNAGGVTYNLRRNSSSKRYKTSIVDADEAVLDAARRVKPRHYESLIPDELGETRLGFIAEEIHDAGLTHAVGYDNEGRPETVDATALIAALWHRVNDLEDRLKALEEA